MRKLFRIAFVFAILALLTSCDYLPVSEFEPKETVTPKGSLQVVFFDVKQADCVLVMTDGHAMLVDAGDLRQDLLVLDYLKKYGITKLDYLVATHPDADHIGSMTSVVNEMESIGEVIMPDTTKTTNVFKNLISAIEAKDIPLTIAMAGDSFSLGAATVHILAPVGNKYSKTNDFSVVLRIDFGDKSFLLAGDAEIKSENEQLDSGRSLQADVLKVGHHGSNTSSGQRYIDAVSPSYAVITCGAGNKFGHPHKEVVDRLVKAGVMIFRTDLNGTIVFITDGITIQVEAQK